MHLSSGPPSISWGQGRNNNDGNYDNNENNSHISDDNSNNSNNQLNIISDKMKNNHRNQQVKVKWTKKSRKEIEKDRKIKKEIRIERQNQIDIKICEKNIELCEKYGLDEHSKKGKNYDQAEKRLKLPPINIVDTTIFHKETFIESVLKNMTINAEKSIYHSADGKIQICDGTYICLFEKIPTRLINDDNEICNLSHLSRLQELFIAMGDKLIGAVTYPTKGGEMFIDKLKDTESNNNFFERIKFPCQLKFLKKNIQNYDHYQGYARRCNERKWKCSVFSEGNFNIKICIYLCVCEYMYISSLGINYTLWNQSPVTAQNHNFNIFLVFLCI
jgi:hypothetical protein